MLHKLNSDIAYDVNELPSKSADLLPEFIHPPWMLDQGWTLDSCMDEKSKATIEKMLQEEQYYLNGKNSTPVTFEKSTRLTKCKPANSKRSWTKEEKKLFEQGLELFGRSWKKIAEIIPNRTSLQVKNYAQNYFKNLSKQNTEAIHHLSEPVYSVNLENPLLTVLATVTTAQPTFPTVTHKELPMPRKQSLKNSSVTSTITNNNTDNTVTAPCPSDLNTLMPVENKQKTGESSESENEDVVVDIEGLDNDENNQVLKNRSASPNSVYIALLQSSNIRKENSERISKKTYASCNKIKPSIKVLHRNVPDVKRVKTLYCSSDDISTNQAITLEKCEKTSSEKINFISASTPLNEEPIYFHNTEEIVNGFCTSEGNIFSYPIPKEEKHLEHNKITEEEKSLFPEFFEGRIAKTPGRFLKIRNYILDCWQNCRPVYLNKTSVRPGLKNCGDVNYIGKIHAYLECTGAINIGCEQASYNQTRKAFTLSSKKEARNTDLQNQENTKKETMRPRRRQMHNVDGFGVSEKQLESRTIGHKVLQSSKAIHSKVVRKIIEDPFRLIPCQTFKKGMEPFQLEIESSALIVMDVHAHMFKTEVVGLLGGECLPDSSYIRIKCAVPCRSISTRIQCEMDAVSQAEASAVITQADQWVVGWYHSHPSFAANPSVRDVESQLKYQEWFARGGAKYVAFIVSPYMGKVKSEMCCLTVEKLENSDSQYMPFQHKYQELNSELDAERCVANIKQLLSQNFSLFENRIYMNKLFDPSSEITYLTKMINSISNYITSDHPDKAHFLALVEELFTQLHPIRNSSKSLYIMNR